MSTRQVEIFRLAGEPIQVEVRDGGTVKDVFSAEGSGRMLGQDGTLMEAADDLCGGGERMGSLRVNDLAADLDTIVQPGATILIVPKVEGGR